MSPCLKCGGLVILERDLLAGDAQKCINCGFSGGDMPKFNSPEAKERWLAAMAARKGKPRKKQIATIRTDGSAAMKTANPIGGIAQAIEEIEQKIAALESVKRQLQRAAELV
jgi:hypothetical protein